MQQRSGDSYIRALANIFAAIILASLAGSCIGVFHRDAQGEYYLPMDSLLTFAGLVAISYVIVLVGRRLWERRR